MGRLGVRAAGRLRRPRRVPGDRRRRPDPRVRRDRCSKPTAPAASGSTRPIPTSSTASNRARPAGASTTSRGSRRTRRKARFLLRPRCPVTVSFDSHGPASRTPPGLAHHLDGHADPRSRRCRSTSRSSSTTCRRAASPGTSSMARRERASCRAARRRRRRSTSAPTEVVTRRSMAGFIERAVHGALTPPPVYLNGFQDVVAGSFNANYIQGLVDDAITAGCSVSPPLYCPDTPVTRAQMAVFMWKALHASEPPPAVRRRVQRRAVPEPVRGLHRRDLQRGNHRGLWRRRLLPRPEHHERPDGRVSGQGV